MKEKVNILHLSVLIIIPVCVWLYDQCIYVFLIKILSSSLNIMLIVDKHCYDEFPVPQIDRNVKQVKQQWHGKFYLQSVWGKTPYFEHRKYQICGWITMLEATKYVIFFIFFYICRKFEFLISQGNVATCLRFGGDVIWDLYQISYAFYQYKNFEYRLRFDKVTGNLKVGTFFETQCILHYSKKISLTNIL